MIWLIVSMPRSTDATIFLRCWLDPCRNSRGTEQALQWWSLIAASLVRPVLESEGALVEFVPSRFP